MKMKNKSNLIEEISAMGDRFALSLLDGTSYEGFILEIKEEYFEFGLGGPMAPDEPIHVKYDELDFSTLSFLDPKEGCYKDAVWDSDKNEWSVSKSK